MGPPGAGKGTQAEMIVKQYGLVHISTGEIMRAAIATQSELGKMLKSYIDQGLLVPDDLTCEIVKERLSKDDVKNGFLLDGFPRTIDQAKNLTKIFEELNFKLNFVINIDVRFDLLVERITGRRFCPKCTKTYHMTFNKPLDANVCDDDQIELVQRSDDTEESVKVRLEEYVSKTKPLLAYYSDTNVLYKVSGENSVQEVSLEICNLLGKSK